MTVLIADTPGRHLAISPLVLAELDDPLTTRIGPDGAQEALAHTCDRVAARHHAVLEVEPHLSSALATMRRYLLTELTGNPNQPVTLLKPAR